MQSSIEFTTVLDLYEHATEAVNRLWTFYSSVALGVVAFALSDNLAIQTTERVVVTVTFTVFALANCRLIFVKQSFAEAAATLVRDLGGSLLDRSEDFRTLLNHTKPMAPGRVAAGHLLAMIGVIIAIWTGHFNELKPT